LRNRSSQQCCSEALALGTRRYGKPPKQRCGHYGITGQLLDQLRRQGVQRDARGRQGVKANNVLAHNVDGHKACDDTALDVLRGLLAQISIERRGPADKPRSIVRTR